MGPDRSGGDGSVVWSSSPACGIRCMGCGEERSIKELEKKEEKLKLDVNSFYNGKVPEWLSKEWDEEEKSYVESSTQIYETTSQLLEKR